MASKSGGAWSSWSHDTILKQRMTNAHFCSASFLHLYSPGSWGGNGATHSGQSFHLKNVIKIIVLRPGHLPGLESFKLTTTSDYYTWGLSIELRQSGLHSKYLYSLDHFAVQIVYTRSLIKNL